MIWERYKRLSWVSHDLPGYMLDINVVGKVVTYTKIEAETGVIVKTKIFESGADALNEGRAEVDSAEREKERQKTESQSSAPTTETSCAI